MYGDVYKAHLIGKGLRLCLPFPPSLNRYYRSVRGRVLISAEGRRCREYVRETVIQNELTGRFPDQRLKVLVQVVAPDKRKRDLDNTCKALLDACTKAGIWGDDSQIDDLHIIRSAPKKGAGFVLLTIEVIK